MAPTHSRRVLWTMLCVLILLVSDILAGCSGSVPEQGSRPASTVTQATGAATAVPTHGPAATAAATQSPSKAQTSASEPAMAPGADLAVWVTHEKAPGQGRVSYKVYYANDGPSLPAEDVALDITIPAGTTVVWAPRDSEMTAEGLVIPLGTLAPRQTGKVDVEVAWSEAAAPGEWTELVAEINAAAPDPNPADNLARDGERVAAPDLALGLSLDGAGLVVPGGSAGVVASLLNKGAAQAAGATLTLTLPVGMTFERAQGSLAGEPAVSAAEDGSQIVLPLNPVQARGTGKVVVQVALDPALPPENEITVSGLLAVAGDAATEDNAAALAPLVQGPGADLWVEIAVEGDPLLDEKRVYVVTAGNRGTERAEGTLTVELPAGLEDLAFSAAPDSVAGDTVTWPLQAVMPGTKTSRRITGRLAAEGPLVARARVTTSGADANGRNDAAEVTEEVLALAMPQILGPSAAVIDPEPEFYGQGAAGATVSLYLAATETEPAVPLGTALVDDSGRWTLAPEVALPATGWHWFTATQTLGERVSPVTGVANYVSRDTGIDTDSLTVNGERVGGIDQEISWPGARVLTFAARIVECESPGQPMLVASYYTMDDVLVNREAIAPASVDEDGNVSFDFRVPRIEQEVQWTLGLSYTCDDVPQAKVLAGTLRPARFLARPLAGLWEDIKCWFGSCTDTPPPPPPIKKQCPGCTPIPPEKRKPKPNPFQNPDDDDHHFACWPGVT